MKHCSKCKQQKSKLKFNKSQKNADGLSYECKKCSVLRVLLHSRTKSGLVSSIYGDQRKNSKNRGMSPPSYSKEGFYIWITSQGNFNQLFKLWVESDYSKEARPSVDRLNDFHGYHFDNIRLTTWVDNNKKSHDQRRNAVGTSGECCKKVDQFSLSGNYVRTHKSISIAARYIDGDTGNISSACTGKRKTAYGFKWSYSK